MALPASDNFDRSNDADLGANWTVPTGAAAFSVNANRALESASGNLAIEYWSADAFNDNQYSESTVDFAGSSLESQVDNGAGPAVRIASGARTCYAAFANSAATGEIQLIKFVAGTPTVLASYTAGSAPSQGDTLRIEANGTTIRVLHNTVERISVTDADIASGSAGIAGISWNNVNGVDNWTGGNLSVAAGSTSGRLVNNRALKRLTGPRMAG